MSEIEKAASALSHARADAATAAEALDRAKAARGRVQARVDALGAERASIVAAARNGASDAQAALRLATADADLSDLAVLAAEHEQAVAAAQADADLANAAISRAQQALDMAADVDTLGKLVAHADRLDELLRQTIREIAAIDKSTGRRPSWAPSKDIYQVLATLHFMRAR